MADFNPDTYLQKAGNSGFDPDKYLGTVKKSAPAISPPPPKEKPGFQPRSFLKDAGAFAYGLGPQNLIDTVKGVGDLVGVPTQSSEQMRKDIPLPQPSKDEEGFVTAGELAPLVVGGARAIPAAARGIGRLAETLGTKLGNIPLISDLTGAKSAQKIAALSEATKSGQVGQKILSRANTAVAQRKAVADNLYKIAEKSMDARYKSGDVWQDSPAAREFFEYLKSRIDTGVATTETSDTRKALAELSKELVGTRTKDGIAYSTPNVLVSTLRELREAAQGDPKEGFKAIAQQDAKELAKRLSDAIGRWEPSLKDADQKYQKLTAQLYPPEVVAGKFSKEKKAADKAVNLLETQIQQGTLKPEDITKQLRTLIKTKSVARLVDPQDAIRLNTELDQIDAIRDKEARARAMAKYAAKLVGGGAAVGAGAGLGYDVFRGGL